MMYLRDAKAEDKELLFEWANDSEVRRTSFHQSPISFETHDKWFTHMMADDSILQFILMDGELPVGQLRLSISGDEAEIGYSIAGPFRGRGYGNRIIQLAAETAKKRLPDVRKLVARVKPSNTASLKVFEKQGYTIDYYAYSLPITEEEPH